MQNIRFKNTTLLITLKDQAEFSKRLIKFLNSQKISINIFIADGSKKSQKNLFKKLKHRFNYFYYGEDKNLVDYYLKIFLSLKKIKTNFIFFCDQDDFINFSCLKKKENFLINNKNYSAAKGLIYNFTVFKRSFILGDRTYRKEVKNEKSLFKRLVTNFHFRSYYCLHRKKSLLKIFRVITKYKISDVRTAEFTMDIMTLLKGQIFLINSCSLLRWMGNKYDIHPIKRHEQTRLVWFFKKIMKNKKLLEEIRLSNKSLRINTFLFTFIIFTIDVFPVAFKRSFIIFRRILLKIAKFFKTKHLDFIYFNIYEVNKVFKIINDRSNK